VLELCHALAGPFCGAILSDLGARVIRVEAPVGDVLRKRRGPDGVSHPYNMVHRNKQAIAIDLRTEQGAALVRRIMDRCDVVLENFRPGVLARYGLDAETSRARLPRLVYCSISAYGQTGPLAREGGVDLIAQGTAGLMSVTGEPGRPPAKAGYPVSDVGAGMWGAIGVLAALNRASATGEGAHIDVALTDSVMAWAPWEVADYQMSGEVPEPLGSAHRLAAPYQAFECAEGGWINLTALPSRWAAFCDLVGAPHLAEDERYASDMDRFRNREPLIAELEPLFRTRTREHWIERLRAIGVPCGPINTIADCMSDPQFSKRDMWRPLADEEGRSTTVLNIPIKDSTGGAPGALRAARALGADTAAVLAELGIAEAELAALQAAGVVKAAEENAR
jgi:crotonobetainyl-CoA:carnitine CoA-transferase CaiB-like acyl-CoA transferase